MSIFGAMNTAVSGLQAQSSAFTNISNNIANSQSIGYKGVGTRFINYLTQSNATNNGPDSVVTNPEYSNTAQGAISQSTDPLALAISGNGFFAVSKAQATPAATATPSFQGTQYYTRAGDFTLNKNGYLVNGSDGYLNGWAVDPATGAANTAQLQPIRVQQGSIPPVATSQVSLQAALPASPAAGQPVSTQVDVYDSLGTLHQLDLNWTQSAPNAWTVGINAPDSSSPALGTAEVKFGNASVNGVPAGTIGSLSNATGTVSATSYSAGGPAQLSFSADFGNGAQPITLDLGTFGGTSGLTQYAGTSFNVLGTTQNGMPQGNFSNVAIDTNGNVAVNYSNGTSQTVAQVPLANFRNADALQSQSGQMYTASSNSGQPAIDAAGAAGSGSLVTGATENSNVDIATQFTKLIAAQEAYSANSKVITTGNQLARTTLNMLP